MDARRLTVITDIDIRCLPHERSMIVDSNALAGRFAEKCHPESSFLSLREIMPLRYDHIHNSFHLK
eukprot:4557267-Pyramimonas_sp.AAC.1